MQRYKVNQCQISNLLSDIQMGQIAIPEIQRPFVWSSIKVRDLMDSLFQGYPIGYIIAWKNPDVMLKDGSLSAGKKIIIDGQQRITALRAAMLGEKVVNKEYKEEKITIAFNPKTNEFATLTPAITKDVEWIANISEFLKSEDILEVVENYIDKNPDCDKKEIQKSFQKLLGIKSKQIGFIELDEDLDIEVVTEIFIRINSKGVVLSQADFAMSKIASNGEFGENIRKLIDYFCHLTREPKFFKQISENDESFRNTGYLEKISWLKDVNDDLYDPDYSDVIRVAFTKNFNRGKLADLVSLLSGRNFETRKFEKEIEEETYRNLESGILDFVDQTNFERFIMIIKSTGYIDKSLINSQNSLNFAYILYLYLKDKEESYENIEKYVKRWFVMSILTGRYSGSSESWFDYDIKQIHKQGISSYLRSIEESDLSDNFWDVGLPSDLVKSSISNPLLNAFFAAQCYLGDKGFISKDITVKDMVSHRGDIHHVFPKEYLRSKYPSKSEYNQIANFVYIHQNLNIKIGKKSPNEYINEIIKGKYSTIESEDELVDNLTQHCIPANLREMTVDNYPEFLEKRRKLMAQKMKKHYQSL